MGLYDALLQHESALPSCIHALELFNHLRGHMARQTGILIHIPLVAKARRLRQEANGAEVTHWR